MTMAPKQPTSDFFKQTAAKRPQTAQDKTAAAAKLIVESEAAKRAELTASLRAARLAKDAGSPVPDSHPDDVPSSPKPAKTRT